MYVNLPLGSRMGVVFDYLTRTTQRLPGYQDIFLALVLGGGGARGIWPTAQMKVLQDLGLHQGFNLLLLSSTGAPPGAYMAANQADVALEAFITICGQRSFIRLHRRGAVALNRVVDAMRGKTYGGRFQLDIDALRRSPMEVYVMASTRAGEIKYLNLKTVDDPITAIAASMALPGWLFGKTFRVNGEGYEDAALFEPLPIAWIEKHFGRAHIAWAPNQSLPLPRSLVKMIPVRERMQAWPSIAAEFLLRQVALYGYPHRLRKLARQARTRLQRRVEQFFYDPGVSASIFPSPTISRITPFTTNSALLRGAALLAEMSLRDAYARFKLVPSADLMADEYRFHDPSWKQLNSEKGKRTLRPL